MATSIGVKLGIDGEAEYRKQLNNIIQSTKTLDKQMEELQSSFTSETSAMEKNAKETDLLQKKAEKLNNEVEMMQKMVEAAAEKFGESSTECQKWEQSLAKAQTELNKTNSEIAEHQKEAEQANSALGQLTETIDSQETELEELKDAYMNAALEYGENSEQAQELAQHISDLSSDLDENRSRLEEVTRAAEDLTTASDDNKSALEELTDEISNQETELDTLRDSYIDAVLQFGEGSGEAQNLASQMSELSAELQTNKQRLDDAKASADGITGSMSGVAGSIGEVGQSTADNLVGQFMPAISGMANTIEQAGVAGAIGVIVSAIKEVGTEVYETSVEFEQAVNDIQIATLATNETLADLQQQAEHTFIALKDKDATIEGVSGVVSTLNTRLGLTGVESARAAEAINAYATMLGVDGVSATNQLADVMQRWGMVTDDDSANVDSLISILDMMITAQASTDVSTESLMDALKNQSGAWQSLGIDMNEAIAMMAAYRDAGGNTADITSALDKVVTNLAGTTDDLQGAWTEAVEIMANSTDRFATLDQEIGDTGKTIADVFGKKKAGQMIDVFSNSRMNADKFSDSINNSKGTLQSLYNDTRTLGDEVSQIWNLATTAMMENKKLMNGELIPEIGSVGDAWDKTWNNIGKALGLVDEKTVETTNNVTKSYDDVKRELKQSVDIKLNSNLDEMARNAADAFDAVKGDWWGAKSVLSQDIELNIVAPSISYSLTGSGNNKYYTPSVSYQRYAQAYDRAMILSAPTIFGAMGNSLLVGGDRTGNEIVVGESHLMDMFTKALRGGGTSINVVVNAAEGMNESELADYVIDRLQMEIIGSEATYA